MRSFGIVSPQFWTGRTGKEIQEAGAECIILGCYLMTSPHSHMCGLYHLPLEYVVYDTGRRLSEVTKAMKRVAVLPSGPFAEYDEQTKHVWIPEMMRFQLGGPLLPNDSRVKAIVRWYRMLPDNPFLANFYRRYHHELPGIEPRTSLKTEKTPGAVDGGVGRPDAPISLSLDLALDPVLKGGVGENKLAYGESGAVRLTPEQYQRLESELCGYREDFIQQLDEYSGINPKQFRLYADHFKVLKNWYRRAVAEGKIRPNVPTNGKEQAEVEEVRRIFRKKLPL